jgi:hypothetical protein
MAVFIHHQKSGMDGLRIAAVSHDQVRGLDKHRCPQGRFCFGPVAIAGSGSHLETLREAGVVWMWDDGHLARPGVPTDHAI